MKKLKALLTSTLAAVCMSTTVMAQTVPNAAFDPFTHVVRLVVPRPPGGPSDAGSRIIADILTKKGLKVVVVNRPGAEGLIGTNEAMDSAPDGYTIFWSSVTTLVVLPITKKNEVQYLEKLPATEHLRLVAGSLFVLAVNSEKIKARNLQDFVVEVKPDTSKFKFSGGTAWASMTGTRLFNQLGIPIKNIPYAGQAPALLDLLEGSVPVGIVAMGPALTHAATGKITILANLDDTQVVGYPNIQTIKSVLPSWQPARSWVSISAPPKTPKYIVNFYSKILEEALNEKDTLSQLNKLGLLTVNLPGEAVSALVKSDYEKLSQ